MHQLGLAGRAQSLPPRQAPLFLVRQKTFDRFHKGLLDHVTESRLALDHGFGEFFCLFESNVRRQRRNLWIRNGFDDHWT